MPSPSRRAFLAATAASAVAGCTSWVAGDSDDTEPAERRVPVGYVPGSDEWIRSSRSYANVAVAPAASPPRESPDERWKIETDGSVQSVVVGDDVVYAGTREGVEALSLSDGDRLWDGPVGGNVTVIDGRCYARSSDRIAALEAVSGETIWDHDPDWSPGDLLEVEGAVYYTDDDGLHGLHADTGERRWTIEADGARYGTLGVDEGALHWLTWNGYRVLEPNGGERPEERASVSFDDLRSPPNPSVPALVDGTAYVGGWGSGVTGRPGAIRALAERGIEWHSPFEPMTIVPTPLEDRLLVAGYDNAGTAMEQSRIAALEPETGTTEWERTVPEPVGAPAVADGTIYAGGAHPGEPSVTVESDDGGDDGESSGYEGRPPAENGGLFAIDVDSGDLLWDVATDGAFAGHPLALVDDAIVLGTRSGVVVLE